MTTMPTMTTAEWQCAQCGATNRKLLVRGAAPVRDRCVTCGARYEIRPGPRPTFWQATPLK
jgi:DNA-directed RNA polymerase subunit RPC12/RpoP